MKSPNTGATLRQLDGTADDIIRRGNQLKTLASTMESTATQLKQIGDSSVHKSKGTDKLADMANETHGDLADAATRYRGTGISLSTYGAALEVAQTWLRHNIDDVERAEHSYDNARWAKVDADRAETLATERANYDTEDDSLAKAQTHAAAEADEAATSLASAQRHRDEMWEAFDGVFDTWSDAYDDAVHGIEKAIDSAGNNDGFWEFVDDLLHAIAILLVVLSIIALVIGAPLTGLLGLVILGLSVASFLLTALKYAYGRATLGDLAWSVVGLLPFGVGKLLSRGVPTLASVVQAGRGAVTSAIRAALPRMRLFHPTTWAKPFQWLFAPVRSWQHLPKPSMWTNPLTAIRLGSSETAQVSSFLNTIRKCPWASHPNVLTMIAETATKMPGGLRQFANVMTWGGFSIVGGLDAGRVLPEIPVLRDIRVS